MHVLLPADMRYEFKLGKDGGDMMLLSRTPIRLARWMRINSYPGSAPRLSPITCEGKLLQVSAMMLRALQLLYSESSEMYAAAAFTTTHSCEIFI
jgi:hypothetical protein